MNKDLEKYTIEELKNLKQLIDIEISVRNGKEEQKCIKKVVELLYKLYDINSTRRIRFEDFYYSYLDFKNFFENVL